MEPQKDSDWQESSWCTHTHTQNAHIQPDVGCVCCIIVLSVVCCVREVHIAWVKVAMMKETIRKGRTEAKASGREARESMGINILIGSQGKTLVHVVVRGLGLESGGSGLKSCPFLVVQVCFLLDMVISFVLCN